MHGAGIQEEYRAFLDTLGDSPEVKQWIRQGQEEIEKDSAGTEKRKKKKFLRRQTKGRIPLFLSASLKIENFRRPQFSDRYICWILWNPPD